MTITDTFRGTASDTTSIERAKLLWDTAWALYNAGNWAESEATFNQLKAIKGYEAQGYYGVGTIRVWQRDLHGAAAQFETALQYRPQYVDVLFQLGNIAEWLSQWESAASLYNQVLAIQPDHVAAHDRLDALSRMGEPVPVTDLARPLASAAPGRRYSIAARIGRLVFFVVWSAVVCLIGFEIYSNVILNSPGFPVPPHARGASLIGLAAIGVMWLLGALRMLRVVVMGR